MKQQVESGRIHKIIGEMLKIVGGMLATAGGMFETAGEMFKIIVKILYVRGGSGRILYIAGRIR